jgi:hypothetical protein
MNPAVLMCKPANPSRLRGGNCGWKQTAASSAPRPGTLPSRYYSFVDDAGLKGGVFYLAAGGATPPTRPLYAATIRTLTDVELPANLFP